MQVSNLLNVQDLIYLTGLTNKQFADAANISTTHLYRALRGEAISRPYAQRITNALNKELQKEYTIEHLDIKIIGR